MSCAGFAHLSRTTSLLSLLKSSHKTFSIELSPSSKVKIDEIRELKPTFVSIIWRFNQEVNLESVETIPELVMCKQLIDEGFHVLLHLACRYLKEQQALNILKEAKNMGVRSIFALKGEYIRYYENTGEKYSFHEAEDLIWFIKQHFNKDFELCVAGYPDCHPRSKNWQDDIEHTRKKIVAGADFIITQAIFDTATYAAYLKRCADHGINVPILPGIWIFDSRESLQNCSNLCKVTVGDKLMQEIEQFEGDKPRTKLFAVEMLSKLIKDLLHCGAPGVHLFSLNKLSLTKEIMHNI